MHKIYELKDKLCDELEEYGDKKLDAGSLEVIDKLAHSIKNLDKIMRWLEVTVEDVAEMQNVILWGVIQAIAE